MSSANVDEIHRKFARDCFNSAWNYLDKSSLSQEEELIMLNLAHTSRFHWTKVGGPKNLAIGDWQISRCYAKINDGESALRFAQSCLQITLDNNVKDNYISAYEGIARAYALLKDFTKAQSFIEKAEKELENVTDKVDWAVYEPQISETKSLIKSGINI